MQVTAVILALYSVRAFGAPLNIPDTPNLPSNPSFEKWVKAPNAETVTSVVSGGLPARRDLLDEDFDLKHELEFEEDCKEEGLGGYKQRRGDLDFDFGKECKKKDDGYGKDNGHKKEDGYGKGEKHEGHREEGYGEGDKDKGHKKEEGYGKGEKKGDKYEEHKEEGYGKGDKYDGHKKEDKHDYGLDGLDGLDGLERRQLAPAPSGEVPEPVAAEAVVETMEFDLGYDEHEKDDKYKHKDDHKDGYEYKDDHKDEHDDGYEYKDDHKDHKDEGYGKKEEKYEDHKEGDKYSDYEDGHKGDYKDEHKGYGSKDEHKDEHKDEYSYKKPETKEGDILGSLKGLLGSREVEHKNYGYGEEHKDHKQDKYEDHKKGEKYDGHKKEDKYEGHKKGDKYEDSYGSKKDEYKDEYKKTESKEGDILGSLKGLLGSREIKNPLEPFAKSLAKSFGVPESELESRQLDALTGLVGKQGDDEKDDKDHVEGSHSSHSEAQKGLLGSQGAEDSSSQFSAEFSKGLKYANVDQYMRKRQLDSLTGLIQGDKKDEDDHKDHLEHKYTSHAEAQKGLVGTQGAEDEAGSFSFEKYIGRRQLEAVTGLLGPQGTDNKKITVEKESSNPVSKPITKPAPTTENGIAGLIPHDKSKGIAGIADADDILPNQDKAHKAWKEKSGKMAHGNAQGKGIGNGNAWQQKDIFEGGWEH